VVRRSTTVEAGAMPRRYPKAQALWKASE